MLRHIPHMYYDNVNRKPIPNNQQAMEDYYGEYT
jgi:hypothetical protein